MTMPNGYDYSVLVIYMFILVGIGVYFSRYMKGAADYFKAANKLTWWVGGLSSFMSAFSAWMFTGGAGIVYREGLTGMVVLGLPGVAIFTGYLLFSRLWRRTRVTTIMEYLEDRFNLSTHQIASWSYIPVYILYSGAALYALAIFISTALNLDIVLVIWVSGLVILAYTLLGGIWAVSINDTVQFLILLPVCLLLVPLSLSAVGGLDGLSQGLVVVALQHVLHRRVAHRPAQAGRVDEEGQHARDTQQAREQRLHDFLLAAVALGARL